MVTVGSRVHGLVRVCLELVGGRDFRKMLMTVRIKIIILIICYCFLFGLI